MAKRVEKSRRITFVMCFILLICIWIILSIFVSSITPSQQQVDSNKNIPFIIWNKFEYEYNLLNNVSSFWSKQNRMIAWRKFLNGTGRMILIHSRKAAGTTMKKWMRSFIEDSIPFWISKIENISSWKCELIHIEAFTNIHNKYNLNNFVDIIMNRYPFGIYVISLRDPIQRILSQYEFEVRWGCIRCGPQRSYMKYNKLIKMNKTNYMKKIDDKYRININDTKMKYANIDFNNFLDRIEIFELNSNDLPDEGKHVRSFGTYINNYYLWMFCCNSKFCNINKDFIQNGKIKQCLHYTLRKIKSFDIVVITEWLNDIRMQLYVNKILFGDIYNDKMFVKLIPFPYPHKIINRGTNYMINKQNNDRLLKWNEWDLKLYQFTKQLVYKRQKLFNL